MDTAEKVAKCARTFYNDLRDDEHARYRSWEHCYKIFHDAREMEAPDTDLLALNLAFYLASWGMYRGSSFLLQKDYKIHIPVVEEILKPKYNVLFGADYKALEENLDLVFKLGCFIKDYYRPIRDSLANEGIAHDLSDTLVTKILMGTMGCVPAYDRYFKSGLSITGTACQQYSAKSLKGLINFYAQNKEVLEEVRDEMKIFDLEYPPMKIVDMGFWQIGLEADLKNS